MRLGKSKALNSLERDMQLPSLLDSTATGRLFNDGSKTRSQET